MQVNVCKMVKEHVCVCVCELTREGERYGEIRVVHSLSLPPSLPPLLRWSPRQETVDEAVSVPNGLLEEHRPVPFAF